MQNRDLIGIGVGIGVATLAAWRYRLRLRLAARLLTGHPVMYRMELRNGTVMINKRKTSLVENTFINDKPIEPTASAVQLFSMN